MATVFPQGVKRPVHVASHLPPPSSEVKNALSVHPLSYTSSGLAAQGQIDLHLTLTFLQGKPAYAEGYCILMSRVMTPTSFMEQYMNFLGAGKA